MRERKATGIVRSNELTRRAFLRVGALAGAAAATLSELRGSKVYAQSSADAMSSDAALAATAGSEFNEKSIAELQADMTRGRFRATDLVQHYLNRINKLDASGVKLKSVLEPNPDASNIAKSLDSERRSKGPRGPLHGIPIFVNDNFDSADKLRTTCGSFALLGPPAPQDSTVVARLRSAGVVLMGKTNLSEWSNFRSPHSSGGWSARGGLTKNPYYADHDGFAGSAVATSSNFCAAALIMDTAGQMAFGASVNGIAGIRPTVGLTSRAGVVPISHNQDTVGVHARTVADLATVLGALVGVDARDSATASSAGKFYTDYTQFLDPKALRGARIGVARTPFGFSSNADLIAQTAIETLRSAGATVVDPANIPTQQQINSSQDDSVVLTTDFKVDIAAYLATRVGLSVRTLADLIAYNNAHANTELIYFGQEIFLQAEATNGTSDPVYLDALANVRSLGGEQGIDAALAASDLDAIIAPTAPPAVASDLVNGDPPLGGSSQPAAWAGYPLITVPAGSAFGLPVGISFMGTAWSEPKLISLAYAFEQAAQARLVPSFEATLPAKARFSNS